MITLIASSDFKNQVLVHLLREFQNCETLFHPQHLLHEFPLRSFNFTAPT